MAMTLNELQSMKQAGEFHHATYRDIGSIWEGLYIYRKASDGFRGFKLIGCFGKDNPDLPAAESIVCGSGVSVGAYGRG